MNKVTAAPSGSVSLDVLSKLRQLAAQRGFAKILFTQGADGVSAYQITMEFKLIFQTLGIVLPPEALITLDVAQAVLAGGTLISDISQGANALQCVNPIGATVAGVSALLADLGVGGTAVTYVADFTVEAVNMSMVIGSCGTNVLADIGAIIGLIKCVSDLDSIFGGSHDEAVQLARSQLKQTVDGVLIPQFQYATSQVQAYQAGNLNPFDMIGNIALNSPASFKNFFPSLATLFPSWVNVTLTATGKSDGWFSDEYDTESFTFQRLLTNKQQVQTVLVKKFLIDPMTGYIQDRYPTSQISLKALSALIMMMTTADGSAPFVSFNFDILGAMKTFGLTPHYLGDYWLFQGGAHSLSGVTNFDYDNNLPYIPRTLPLPIRQGIPALTFNGKASYSEVERKNLVYFNALKKFQYSLIQADRAGNIDALMDNQESLAMLKGWAQIDILPTWPNDVDPATTTRSNYCLFEPLNLQLKSGCTPITSQAWFDPKIAVSIDQTNRQYMNYFRQNYLIDLSDYWKSLATLKSMEKANLFADPQGVQDLRGFGNADDIQKCFKTAFNFYMAKSLNTLARENVSTYTGIPLTKLQGRLTKTGAVVFKTRGI